MSPRTPGVPHPWRSLTATWVGKYPLTQPPLCSCSCFCRCRCFCRCCCRCCCCCCCRCRSVAIVVACFANKSRYCCRRQCCRERWGAHPCCLIATLVGRRHVARCTSLLLPLLLPLLVLFVIPEGDLLLSSLPLSLPLPPHPNPVISTEAVCAFANCVAEKPASLPIQPASPLSLRPNFRTIPNKGRVIVPRRIRSHGRSSGSNNTTTS